jgi:beta-glucosidase
MYNVTLPLNYGGAKKLTADIKSFFNNKKLLLWGAAANGKFYAEFFLLNNIKPDCFLDKNADKIKKVYDLPVINPEDYFKESGKTDVLFITANKEVSAKIIEYVKLSNYVCGDIIDGSQCFDVFRECKRMLRKNGDIGDGLQLCIESEERTESWWIHRHKEIIERMSNERVEWLFLGDSITHFWQTDGDELWGNITKKYSAMNLGFNMDRTVNLLWRLQNGEFPQNICPKYIFLMIGLNNIYMGDSPQKTAKEIKAIIQYIHATFPDVKVFLFSVLPRVDGAYLNEDIDELNMIISSYNTEPYITYCDLAKYYKDNTSGVIRKYYLSDNVHLSREGYAVWFEKLKEIVGL